MVPEWLRNIGRLALAASLAVLAPGPASAQPAVGGQVTYACESGKRFRVDFLRDRVRITTIAGRWLLASRPSSIGRRYSSETATFIQDGDFAALNGLPGGPFRRCIAEAPLLGRGRLVGSAR